MVASTNACSVGGLGDRSVVSLFRWHLVPSCLPLRGFVSSAMAFLHFLLNVVPLKQSLLVSTAGFTSYVHCYLHVVTTSRTHFHHGHRWSTNLCYECHFTTILQSGNVNTDGEKSSNPVCLQSGTWFIGSDSDQHGRCWQTFDVVGHVYRIGWRPNTIVTTTSVEVVYSWYRTLVDVKLDDVEASSIGCLVVPTDSDVAVVSLWCVIVSPRQGVDETAWNGLHSLQRRLHIFDLFLNLLRVSRFSASVYSPALSLLSSYLGIWQHRVSTDLRLK